MSAGPDTPAAPTRLSVVVAAQDARATVGPCLRALESQRADGVAQVILVDNSTDGTADHARRRFPGVEVVERAGGALVPELWGEGIRRSREDVVALTTAEMVADDGWARALLGAYAGRLRAGVGGAILPGPGLRLRERAVYWLRYSRYAAGRVTGPVRDIAADNGSYRRRQLAPFAERVRREGFWENEINAVLCRDGLELFAAPEAIVRYRGGTRFGRFARQRLAHGRRFGRRRMAGLARWQRPFLLAAWPLTPLAFLARIGRDALRAGQAGSLVGALPPLLWLLACWSVGELRGYLAGVLDAARAGGPAGSTGPDGALEAPAETAGRAG